jgi:hypothetical protein
MLPLEQLLVGRGAVPERYRPLQAVGFYCAGGQQGDGAIENCERLLRLVGDSEQRNAIFIIRHDACHVFAGRGFFGLIELCLASRNRSPILRL